jgi:hypothetical protein
MDRSEESFQNGPWRARPAGGTPKASRRSWAGRSDTGAKEAAVHRLSGVDVAAVRPLPGQLGVVMGQPAGVASQQGFGLRAHAPPPLLAFGGIALGFLGARHELPPGREADLPGDDQPRVAQLGGGGIGGSGVPQPGQRARVAAAQLGEQAVGLRGISA